MKTNEAFKKVFMVNFKTFQIFPLVFQSIFEMIKKISTVSK